MVTMRVLITTSISEEASSLDGGRRVRPRRLRLALLAGLTLALGQGAPALAHAAAGSVAAATPVTIQCGQDITASITVANDLTCPGSALTISADNVTVNLGGHAITGSGQGTGITLSPNSDEAAITGATVSNGTIENFGTAVFFDQAVDSTFDKVSLINDAAGDSPVFTTFVPGGMAHGVQITHSKILDTGGFITYADLETSQFSFTDTDIDTGEFYFSQTIGGPTFTDDHFTDVTLDLDIEGGTTVTGSSFDDSPVINNDNGFGYDTFENNTFTGAGTALTIATVGNQQLLDNTFTGNDIGAVISGSLGDTISGNTFTRNATAGVFYNDTTGAPPGTGSNPGAQLTVSDNVANANGKSPDGSLDPGNLPVEGGIYLYLPNGGATITDNHTSHNGGYGIFAPPSFGGSFYNTTSGNISTGDFGKCYPLAICTYN
jgi:hypothetical protein